MARQKDAAHKLAEEKLGALEREYSRIYGQAAREMKAKQEKALAKYQSELSQRLKALDPNDADAVKRHKKWLEQQASRQAWLNGMVDELSESAVAANGKAANALRGTLPAVIAESANAAAYKIESKVGYDMGFTLVNEEAVRQLVMGGEPLIPEVGITAEMRRLQRDVRIPIQDTRKDMRWNRQKFKSAIMQGILQGESVQGIADRTGSIYGMNMASAIRAARTATTNAENAGRVSSFERAQSLGIDMEIEWLATLDDRTRESHREMDGERIKLGERFSNGLRWPGDEMGDPSEVWNCRCRADGEVVGFDGKRGELADEEPGERWSRLPEGMTYDEWKAGKAGGEMEQSAPDDHIVVDGKDILGTWQRRPERYDFEIEDVMAAQGFDGKPRIVGADEFDAAVKRANGGDGLIMQRTYTAPDQATLDAYRDMLYDGKWYVDCSTGGAQYGQGMYAVADYTGKLSAGVESEVQHYIDLGRQRNPITTFDMLTDVRKSEMVDESIRSLGLSGEKAEAAKTMMNYELKIGKFDFNNDWGKLADASEKLMDVDYMGEVARLRSYRSEPAHYVETMTLDPSAKIVEWGKISAEKERAAFDIREQIIQDVTAKGGTNADIKAALEAHPTYGTIRFMDDGAYAAMRGYDAINAVGHGTSGSYTVVLNRTKLIIRRPE